MTDEEWAFVLPYLLLSKEDSASRTHDLRAVFDAYRYLLRAGCGWRMLPGDFPPWTSEGAAYDGAKRVKGRKLHLAVDTLGHLLAAVVTPADARDRAAVAELCAEMQAEVGGRVSVAFVDQGYTGAAPAWAAAEQGIELLVVKHAGPRRGFVLLPRRWVEVPQELNTRRPVASPEYVERLLAVADQVDPTGRFRCVLLLARHTGRRMNAICCLSAGDVLRTREQVQAALGAAGLDLASAAHWPRGAIRWSAATDKLGYEAMSPLSAAARGALDVYVGHHPRISGVPLFPRDTHPDHPQPIHKNLALEWLRRTVVRAKLPAMDRFGYHALRRLWATERRLLPVKDVATAGGWRSVEVLQRVYQHTDAAMRQSVVEAASPAVRNTGSQAAGHRLDTLGNDPVVSQQVT